MKYKNLTILGTSHIAAQSLQEVEDAIEKEQPAIVALELDKKRAYALLHNIRGAFSVRDIRRVGIKGFLFSLVGAWIERKLGDKVGVAPGEEMKTALQLAKMNKIKVALIDQDIEITLKRFSKALTWSEKTKFIIDLIKSPFSKQNISFDLSKVPSKSMINRMIKEVKSRYPNIYKVLVEERNVFMAMRLMRIMKVEEDKKIMAIVGAGHEEEILQIIKKDLHKIDVTKRI